jgi:hypothetical protein
VVQKTHASAIGQIAKSRQSAQAAAANRIGGRFLVVTQIGFANTRRRRSVFPTLRRFPRSTAVNGAIQVCSHLRREKRVLAGIEGKQQISVRALLQHRKTPVSPGTMLLALCDCERLTNGNFQFAARLCRDGMLGQQNQNRYIAGYLCHLKLKA